MPEVMPDGPVPAKIMVVGEAPGVEEEAAGKPFVGVSGQELNRMLQEAGILRSEVFTTNVCRVRPPGNDIEAFIALKKKNITPAHRLVRDKYVLEPVATGCEALWREVEMVRPNVILALGNTSMWALTGKWGITKWRGSMLRVDTAGSYRPKVVPTYHPAAILRQWSWRATGVHDMRRASAERHSLTYATEPKWSFIIRPSYPQVIETLQLILSLLAHGPRRLSFDLETRAGHIACAGISWTLLDAICIPFMCVENKEGYWSVDEEGTIIFMLYQILTHPNAQVVGQNILYDAQYTYRHWHFVPRVVQDCMISQHSIFSDLPKALAYQASMYCNWYVYWKDEGKDWAKNMGENQLWTYNCQDCVYTDEAGQTELELVKKLGLEKVHEFQQQMFWPVLQAMQRGVLIDKERRKELVKEVEEQIETRENFLKEILGHPLNVNSAPQMQKLFYNDFQQKVIMTRPKKGAPARPTLNDEALVTIALREPLLKPLVNAISDIRTLRIFLSHFLRKPLDVDGRMRCSYNIGGSESGKSAPKTYRLSSSENAFGSGANLQNIPSEKSKSIGKAAKRGSIAMMGDPYLFPNIRSMFIPDPGYTFYDIDLDRADLQVVAWEAEDELLKTALRLGADIHLLNCYSLEGRDPPPMEELVESHPAYSDHRGPRKHAREFAKVFCHATNYVGSARTVAAHTGKTVHEVDRSQKIWFNAHPGIKNWHTRTQEQIKRYRFVENKFGYRWYIFDRVEAILPEAVAWIPQSTVSITINKIWDNIYDNVPEVWVLLQTHDSLSGQIPSHLVTECLPKIKQQARIVIPYDDPLIIPTGIELSDKSWGDCVSEQKYFEGKATCATTQTG